jgi:hypothetical protein
MKKTGNMVDGEPTPRERCRKRFVLMMVAEQDFRAERGML